MIPGESGSELSFREREMRRAELQRERERNEKMK